MTRMECFYIFEDQEHVSFFILLDCNLRFPFLYLLLYLSVACTWLLVHWYFFNALFWFLYFSVIRNNLPSTTSSCLWLKTGNWHFLFQLQQKKWIVRILSVAWLSIYLYKFLLDISRVRKFFHTVALCGSLLKPKSFIFWLLSDCDSNKLWDKFCTVLWRLQHQNNFDSSM